MFAAARPRNIDLRPPREDGYRTACRTQRGIYQVERFFALLTDQHFAARVFLQTRISLRDRTASLGRQDSNSEMSAQILLKGHTDLPGSSRILAAETIRV
jgi:hypothetical protein